MPLESNWGVDGGDGGGYGEASPYMMETLEHFPSLGNMDPSRGYSELSHQPNHHKRGLVVAT